MKKTGIVIGIISIIVLIIIFSRSRFPVREEPLICHVGGTMNPVMIELVRRYEQKTGQAIEM